MHTSWQTSVMRLAVRSLTSLWRSVWKPPFGQDRACSTVKLEPQGHVKGVCSGCQPYLSAMASFNAPLWRVCPNSSRERAVSEAPFSCVKSIARWRDLGAVALRRVAEELALSRFSL